jgi:hypothetical protein
MSDQAAPPAGIPGPSAANTLAVTSLATLLVLVTFTIPVSTLTSTSAALDAGGDAQAWILSAMSVGAAAGLLSSGAIGDGHDRSDFRNTVPRFAPENRKANQAVVDRLEENLGAGHVELSEANLREIERALSQITMQGHRYSESAQRTIDR